MGDIILLGNLKRKRAYLQGEIEAKECQLGCLRDDLETIDRMIKLVDAGTNPKSIKGIRPHQRPVEFKQGDQTKLCYTILREADIPLSSRAIAEGIAARKSVPLTPELIRRVRGNLTRLTKAARLVRSGKPRARTWRLP